MAKAESVERLRQFFKDQPDEQQASGWESMWQEQVTPWDRNTPNLALVDALKDKRTILGSALKAGGTRKQAFVPGCGKGYDVFLLSSWGYDAVGIDVAPTAVAKAREQLKDEEQLREQYPIVDDKVGAGDAVFCLADFFADSYLSNIPGKHFDLIYDYTFLCALPPALRPKWAARMADLLAPDGILICVEFPLDKPLNAGGPPHGLSSNVYTALFNAPGKDINYDRDGNVVQYDRDGNTVNTLPEHTPNALQRIDHWQPRRSHHAGQGKDMVSLWKHIQP